MKKPRPDSLYARLQAAGKDDEFFRFVFGAGADQNLKQLVALCESWGLETSIGGVWGAISDWGMTWKITEANKRADAQAGLLPADAEAKVVEARKQIEFDLAYSDLSTKERLALLKYFEEKRSLDLEVEKFRATVQSDIDRALEAFKNELQGNAAALAAFAEFRAKVKTALEKKAA